MFPQHSHTFERKKSDSHYRIIKSGIIFYVLCGLLFFAFALPATAATLSMDPSSGTFVVGSTFEVPIFVNSENERVNAIEILAKFPPDKLQLISPSTGKSIITLWTEQPSYDNQTGLVSIQGVIPNGITTGKGLVTTMTFRVKAPGDAYLKFLDKTRVLKHDGLGTDVLRETYGGVYHFILPPPAGPIVASQTHPDPYTTYRTNDVFLSWTPEDPAVTTYSYVLNDSPVDIPDDIPEGTTKTVMYQKLADGKNFFHIKGYRLGVWGGVTNFAINIDTNAPAAFPVQLLPDAVTEPNKQVIVQFNTTDPTSGVDHYELKVVSRTLGVDTAPQGDELGSQPLFIEATSPYVLQGFSNEGKYDIIVRAYDKAGNSRESVTELNVSRALFGVINTNGLGLGGGFILPWWVVILILLLILLILLLLVLSIRKRHAEIDERLRASQLPHTVASRASDLAEKQKQYVNITQLVVGALFIASSLFGALPARADVVTLDPPLITTLSRNIDNDEIFYVGGTTGFSGATIVVYLQNKRTGETISQEALVDQKGQWFYRHNGFLAAGDYILWTGASVGGQMSPPSPQERILVSRTALQLGSSRFTYEFVFGMIALALFILVLVLLLLAVYHARHARIKHARWMKEVGEAEEAVRTGFAVLRRDIMAELDLVRKAKMTATLRAEEVGREEQLLKDLAWIESNISKEVTDIEKEL